MSKITIQAPEQYLHELHGWERTLDFYKQENAFLKMHLSEMVDKYSDLSFVEPAEQFNNRFVFIDEYILALQQDIRLQEQMLQQHLSGDHSQDTLMKKLQLRLQSAMEKFEKEVTVLKKNFNQQMADMLRLS
ncbi:MAG: hypothetical protein QM687_13580 [Ferruginibacter sp.]